MNLEPLYELKNRLENVSIVGINLVKDDFRLQRAVDQMKGYASAAKVFKQIYEMGQKLIEDDEEDKCDLLLDLLALLDAVLCTQATTYSGDNLQKIETTAGKENFYQELHYSELSELIAAFKGTGGGRFRVIDSTLRWDNPEIVNDFRVKKFMINGLNDSYSGIIDLMIKMLKKQGKEIVPLLKEGFNPQGKKEMIARLEIIENICKGEENEFYKYCVENGGKEVKEVAIGALVYDQDNVDYLLDLMKKERGKLKNKVFESLAYMDDERVKKEWDKFFRKKPFENMEYMARTEQQWVSDYINNYIKEYTEDLKNKTLKTKEERRKVQEEVAELCSVSSNKRTEKTLSLYKELYPYNKAAVKRILSHYIVTEINKEITNLIKKLSKIYEGEFLEQEFLISLIKDKPETTYKNFSKFAGAEKDEKGIKKLFHTFFANNKLSKNKEEAKVQEDFSTLFNVIFHIHYDEENKEYILYWQNINDYSVMKIKLNGFDKKWYNIIFNIEDDFYGNWNYYSSYHRDLKSLYNPDIKGMKEKYGKFYYNIILSRTPYDEDIEFLNKLEWKDYKDFLKGKMRRDLTTLSYRIIRISYFIKDVPISEEDLKAQIEELLEKYKKLQKSTITICEEWLDKLNSGVKVKDL